MGEIASYHERESSLLSLVPMGYASIGLCSSFPFCLPCDGSSDHQFKKKKICPFPPNHLHPGLLLGKKKEKEKKDGNLTETRILENVKNQNKRFLLEPRNSTTLLQTYLKHNLLGGPVSLP